MGPEATQEDNGLIAFFRREPFYFPAAEKRNTVCGEEISSPSPTMGATTTIQKLAQAEAVGSLTPVELIVRMRGFSYMYAVQAHMVCEYKQTAVVVGNQN